MPSSTPTPARPWSTPAARRSSSAPWSRRSARRSLPAGAGRRRSRTPPHRSTPGRLDRDAPDELLAAQFRQGPDERLWLRRAVGGLPARPRGELGGIAAFGGLRRRELFVTAPPRIGAAFEEQLRGFALTA